MPQRIASLISSATEILCGLGLGDRLVAVSHECDWPPEIADLPRVTRANIVDNASSNDIDDQVKSQLAAGEPLYTIDCERLEALRPDLIVTQAQCDVCAVRYDDVVEMVANSPVLSESQIVSLAPETLDDLYRDIRSVAAATNVDEAAESYIHSLQARLESLRESLGDLTALDRPRVAIVEWLDPLMVAGNWTPGMVARAGGRYDLAEEGRHSPYLEWSQLVEYDPEVLVIAPCGFDIMRTRQELATLTSRDEWQQLTAVRERRTYVMDGNAYLNRSGPRLVDTVEILAHLIHPDRCGPPASVTDIAQAWQKLDEEVKD